MRGEEGCEIDSRSVFLIEGRVFILQEVRAANQVIQARKAQLSQQFTHLFGDEGQEVDEILWLAGEFGAQVFALRGNASGTGVEVTLTRHVAAQRDEGRRTETNLFSPQHGSDDHVPTRLEATIRAHFDALAQAVAQ